MKVAFRMDASQGIGAGHFMRCLALADGLRARGASIRIVSRELPSHLAAMLAERSIEARPIAPSSLEDDARDTARAIGSEPCDWLVVDHYGLDARWEAMMRPHARRLMAIDDLADRPHDCEVLLDQNLHADGERRYGGKVPAGCRVMLGPQYALLRDEFHRARRAAAPRTGAVARLLVSFGGEDAGNHTGRTLDALAACGRDVPHVDVVIGAGHPFRDEIAAVCARHDRELHVQTGRMAALFASADMAIGAGGTSTWERCCLGLPALALAAAANQRPVIDGAARHGLLHAPAVDASSPAAFAVHIRALLESPALREMLSRNGLQAVDGRGVERVVRILDRGGVRVREASAGDARALFEWRNHESVRVASRSPEPIDWRVHEAWFVSVLADADRVLLIGERDGAPVGVVRFDITRPDADVSVYRVPSSEPGAGVSLLGAAEAWLAERREDVSCLRADVLGDNEASHRLFQSSGYTRRSTTYTKRLHPS